MFVPKENILGQIGKGLKLALTVLDFGRTTFGASCTGAAKFCVEQMVARANDRRQFGQTLGEFEPVKEKIALAAADTFAMESATYHTAALIDSGAEDYMLETAMLKVFASDALWRIVNDCLQIWGGAGFFTDQPFERMMRDARLNLIGEGANDVLRSFIAMYGLRNVGKHLEGLTRKPWQAWTLFHRRAKVPKADLVPQLQTAAYDLAYQIAKFASACQGVLIKHREGILNRQLIQARLGDIATDLFMASCVYARLLSQDSPPTDRDMQTGLYYLHLANRRNKDRLRALKDNDDAATVNTANVWLQGLA
jgi:alkylation response protein AidB-like acyl-CoA dehydrogenase